MHWLLGAFMRTEFLWFSVLRVTSGHRVKLAGRKSVSNPSVVYSADGSEVVVPVSVLLFVALWFILRGDLFYVLPCVILFLCCCFLLFFFFSHFSIAIISLGEVKASFGAFRTFVWFVIVWCCLFPLPRGVWEGLWFVIVALPGLFSFPFYVEQVCIVFKMICGKNLGGIATWKKTSRKSGKSW